MGQHSSPEQGPFYRSVIAWFLPWIAVAGIVIFGVAIAVNRVGPEDVDEPPQDRVVSRSPSPEASDTPEPTDSPRPRRTPAPTKSPSPDEGDKSVALITEGISIQVLNATASEEAADVMAGRLTGLGYTVVATNPASGAYSQTTVFWSYPEAQEAAEALADRFGWVAQQKPDNLSDGVALHVVVGQDEA